ncbi:MAG: ATP-binding protein [Rectinemataceae bacterium]
MVRFAVKRGMKVTRIAEGDLIRWYQSSGRKPLVVRGARQVGKSTLVRLVAQKLGLAMWEVNLERHQELGVVFASLDSTRILQEIGLALNQGGVGKGVGILFLDEIQAIPAALSALRYFHEEKPDLAVVAAGSLLEFALGSEPFSMPVGRIEYCWLGPMTFIEFLEAVGEYLLVETLKKYRLDEDFPMAAHERLLPLLRMYFLVGGMPEAVARFAESRDIVRARQVHSSILETYRDDFRKYAKRADLEKIWRIYEALPSNIGLKTRYNRFHPDWKASDIRRCLELLQRAGIVDMAVHTDGTGLPLGAAEDPTVTKLFHLDCGLVSTALGGASIPIANFLSGRYINEGTFAEQVVAQLLLRTGSVNSRPQLHWWLRGGKSANAEVDFITATGGKVLPIEVKSGSSGSLRSLHQFMLPHQGGIALRLDLNPPSCQDLDLEVMTASGKTRVCYSLVNLPLYLAERIQGLIGEDRASLGTEA